MSFAKTSVESRRADCARLLAANPGAVPVAAQAAKSGAAKPALVALPRTATIADLAAQLNCTKGTTLLIDDCTPASTTTLGDLHDCCQAEDGFVHVTIVSETRLGNTVSAGCGNIGCGQA